MRLLLQSLAVAALVVAGIDALDHRWLICTVHVASAVAVLRGATRW